ncbi:MAG: ComEC/Rec2 family competence protein, partial [Chitinophagales bacterium]
MQYNLSQIPLAKILIPIILGIGIFEKWTIGFNFLFILSCILCCILLILHYLSHHPTIKKWNTLNIYLLQILLGGLLITQKQLTQQKNHFSNYKAVYAKGIIATELKEKPKSYKTVLNIQKVYDSLHTAIPSVGNLMLYIEKDSSLLPLEIGDEILIRLNYNKIKAPKNIAEFDYRTYLKHQSIYHQQYVAKHQLIVTQKNAGFLLKRLGFHISQYIRNILKTHIPKTENFALADGILLGNDDLIDRNLYDTFAQTGILHILSVSGLHVGIVYLLLQLLLGCIRNKSKQTKMVKFLIILVCIWMFTLITGASTACVRAAILFTLIHSGTLQKEHVNNINLLAGAALIQVVYNANVIYDIGFQLSYLAMLGLFIFYKPIYATLYFKSYVLDKVWQLWSASIAAQLLTLPLSIYYFGNFPTYFLIANLYAIPLSFVILWSCILLIPFCYIPILGIFWGKFIS